MPVDRGVEVLEAAALLLEEQGGERFNTNHLSKRSGVPIGSLYKLFKDADAVLLALLAREQQAIQAGFPAIDANDGFRSGSVRLVSALVAHNRKRPSLALQLDGEERRLRPAAGPRALVHRTLDRCLRLNGAPRVADPDTSAIYLTELVTGMALAACADQTTSIDRWAEKRIAAALEGYMAGGPYRAGP